MTQKIPSKTERKQLAIAKAKAKAEAIAKTKITHVGPSPQKAAADWLNAQVSKKAQNTLIGDLTPALAEILLERNTDNRKLSQATVDQYARDMITNNWQLNGEAIVISDGGELNDGQHRCWAVYQSGVTIKTVFVIGMKRETMATLDQGRNRRLSDYLTIEGKKYAIELAAAASLGFEYVHKNTLYTEGRYKPTRQEVAKFIEEFPNLSKSVEFIAPNKLPRYLGGRGYLCFIHWVFSRKNAEKAEEFMLAFIHGMSLEANSPILTLRNRLLADTKMRKHPRTELIFRAWNAWRSGGTGGSVRVLGGPLPEVVG